MSHPVVAIVGRPNVGKSALFNRLIGRRMAIVEDRPGITRDRLYAETSWGDRPFILIDTGGYVTDAAESITAQVRVQADRAIQEADVILYVVDMSAGVLPADKEMAELLRAGRRPVLLVVNKVDEPHHPGVFEFYELALGDPHPVSATHGLGINDLLDEVVAMLPEPEAEAEAEATIRVAVVGRPNVGKSSLINAILGEDRVIVDATPGTTRDAVDTLFRRGDRLFTLVDTAGLRRKARIDERVERYSAGRSLGAIDRADVVVLVLDAGQPVVEQDMEIARYAQERGRAFVAAVSKWDLASQTPELHKPARDRVKTALRFASYGAIVATSATRRWGIPELLDRVVEAFEAHGRRVPTGPLNRIIEAAEEAHNPPANRTGRQGKIYYATQPSVKPPTIVCFVNDAELFPDEYGRYLENRLREAFDFLGTPIRLQFRQRQREQRAT